MLSKGRKKIKIGIVGCGAIGEGVALFVDKKLKGKAVVSALAELDKKKAVRLKSKLKSSPKILDIDSLIKSVDLVIEVASQNAAEYILKKGIAAGKYIIILSMGALLRNRALLKKAERKGVKIYIPSGAICGVDGLRALSLGKIRKVSLVSSKPPKGFLGVDYLKKKGIDPKKLRREKVIFQGTVSEAIKNFPKNINVAATLLFASNFSNVSVCIKADPKVKRNTHRIEIDAKEARVSITIENVPSKRNPKTSTLTILSAQDLLNRIFSSFKIGS
jgi:aspartate dehydrogenase